MSYSNAKNAFGSGTVTAPLNENLGSRWNAISLERTPRPRYRKLTGPEAISKRSPIKALLPVRSNTPVK